MPKLTFYLQDLLHIPDPLIRTAYLGRASIPCNQIMSIMLLTVRLGATTIIPAVAL